MRTKEFFAAILSIFFGPPLSHHTASQSTLAPSRPKVTRQRFNPETVLAAEAKRERKRTSNLKQAASRQKWGALENK